ncbi:MAG: geranylgeranylglyceryl/heptaprenylglyceryl phosphate synthase [Candidatus Marinimicrobia bacterium]|nr:geranylgeranylglyceryl/heptaprenylglyceryl phosphate synthase [Candidatus Neomarinimicrobiota bacterium]
MFKGFQLSTFSKLEKIRVTRGAVAIALLDPDLKNDKGLINMLQLVNESDFDAIFIGGSLISDNEFESRLEEVVKNTELPVIIFPGSSNQLSQHADAVLFLSLISGRNPQYLIGEHVKSAPIIRNMKLEAIPTAYILLDGGVRSSVEVMSNTSPIPMNKHDIIMAHALAGEYLGNKFVFLEAGSGAENHAASEVVSILSEQLQIPIIVGGGVNTPKSVKSLVKSGAGYIVTGTKIEQNPSLDELLEFTNAVHQI